MSNSNSKDPLSKEIAQARWRLRISRIKTVIVLLALLYIAVTIAILSKNWENIFYTVTHKEDIEWVKSIKDNAWEDKKTKMMQEKQAENAKEVSFAKKKELPANLKQLVEGTPMEEMEEAIVNNKYGVSPYLIVGIAKAESNFGTDFYHWKDYRNYNYWGIKPSGGIRKDGSYLAWYSSPEEGVNEISRIIKENYIDQGFDTVEKIMTKYVGPDSPRWVATVKSVLALSETQTLVAFKQ